jgi:hypothetical protein
LGDITFSFHRMAFLPAAFLCASPALGSAAAPFFEQQHAFVPGADGCNARRIPGSVATRSGALLLPPEFAVME